LSKFQILYIFPASKIKEYVHAILLAYL